MLNTTPSAAAGSVIDGRYAWTRLALSVFLGTIGSVGMWAIVVVLPFVQADFGIDRAQASLPYAATMVGFAIGNVVIGRYVDRFGVVLPVAGAASILGAAFMLAATTTSIWQFVFVQLFVGLGASATFGPMVADISHWFERHRGIAITSVASGNYLAGVIWPVVISALLPHGGWRLAFVVIGIVCILVMVPLSLLLKRRPPREAEPTTLDGTLPAHPRHKRIDLSPRALQILLVCAGLGCCVAMSMPQVHIVAYCTGLGYGAASGAQMLSVMLGAGIVSRLFSGFLADRIGGVRTLLAGSVLQCISLVLYLPSDGLVSLYTVSLIFGLSQGGIVPCYAIIVREYLPAREAGQRVGIVIMATIVGMAFGGWLAGWIYDLTGSYQVAFINGIAWNVMNIAVMTTVLMKSRGGPAAATAA